MRHRVGERVQLGGQLGQLGRPLAHPDLEFLRVVGQLRSKQRLLEGDGQLIGHLADHG